MRGILLIRHGNTTYDNKVDALLDPPLNEDGAERIKRTVEFVKGLDFEYERIISSPLQRALKVAETLADGNKKVTPNNAALPWNLGDFMGRPNEEVDAKIKYLERYPDIRAPHGESYRTFYLRWTGFLDRLMKYSELKPQNLVVTTHSRNINALQEFIGGAPIGDVKETAPEGSVTLLAQNGVSEWNYEQIWDGK